MRKMAVLCLAVVALSCDGGDGPGVACPAIAMAGMSVGVTSAQTAQPVCDATVAVVDGTYREQLSAPACRYVGAWERAGTYLVRVDRTGFVTKEVAGVRVTMGTGDCPHVQEVRLDIQLIPSPERLAALRP